MKTKLYHITYKIDSNENETCIVAKNLKEAKNILSGKIKIKSWYYFK